VTNCSSTVGYSTSWIPQDERGDYLTPKRPGDGMREGRALKRWSLALLGLGLACLVAFRLIGSEVDADGVLREPFALIPIGWFSISLGLILAAVYAVGQLTARDRGPPQDPN
jgi:hypothetical protein